MDESTQAFNLTADAHTSDSHEKRTQHLFSDPFWLGGAGICGIDAGAFPVIGDEGLSGYASKGQSGLRGVSYSVFLVLFPLHIPADHNATFRG